MNTIHVEYSQIKDIQPYSEPCVMALGFFDGVHVGHQEIIKAAKIVADRKRLKLAVMTFTPHPSTVIKKGKQISKYITPIPTKEKIFEKLGVDLLYIVEFTTEVAQIPHDLFVEEYLYGFHCRHAVAGFDYTYGFKGKGDMAQLTIDAKGRFGVTTVEKKEKNQLKVSSTLLRELITSGRVEKVPAYLGNRYQMEGTLKKQGYKYSFYTHPDYLIPCPGSYEVTLKAGTIITKGICEVTKDHEEGVLLITPFYDVPFNKETDVQLFWENFISDYQMGAFHAQARFEDVELSV